MRLVNLLATLGPNMIGPVLMIAGLAISLSALAFLIWRRRAGSQERGAAKVETVEAQEVEPAKIARRRPLVSDPERASSPLDEGDRDETEAEWEELPHETEVVDEPSPEEPVSLQIEHEELPVAETLNEGLPAEPVEGLQDIPISPPTHEEEPASPIEAARWRPIVFRQFIPQGPGMDGLSFYGGKPIGPVDFVWPRGRGEEGGPPLTFVMQWDCAQLAEQDATGLLPPDGVLYCFLNLDWGNHEEYTQGHTFVHYAGPTDGWGEVDLPEDARPVFGEQGAWQMAYCTQSVENAQDFVPRTLARFPFEPIAMDYPVPDFEDEYGEHRFWNDDWSAEAVLAAQKVGRESDDEIRDIERPHLPFARPFPAFPHDFGAIRILAAAVLRQLERPDDHPARIAYPDLSDEERSAQFAKWAEEAKELYELGCQRPMRTHLEQNIADDIWAWAEARERQLAMGFDRLVNQSVDLSIGIGSESLDAIPEDLIEDAMRGHALAREFMTDERPSDRTTAGIEDFQRRKESGELERVREVFTRNPARIFGPPSYVQGYVEEMIDDHLLLLELFSASGPEHHFGEGVLQYLITPEDLAAGRFDQVKSVISGY